MLKSTFRGGTPARVIDPLLSEKFLATLMMNDVVAVPCNVNVPLLMAKFSRLSTTFWFAPPVIVMFWLGFVILTFVSDAYAGVTASIAAASESACASAKAWLSWASLFETLPLILAGPDSFGLPPGGMTTLPSRWPSGTADAPCPPTP